MANRTFKKAIPDKNPFQSLAVIQSGFSAALKMFVWRWVICILYTNYACSSFSIAWIPVNKMTKFFILRLSNEFCSKFWNPRESLHIRAWRSEPERLRLKAIESWTRRTKITSISWAPEGVSRMSSPEPEVRPVVHVWLVSVIDLAAEHLGQGEPRAEGPGPAEPHPDHLNQSELSIND